MSLGDPAVCGSPSGQNICTCCGALRGPGLSRLHTETAAAAAQEDFDDFANPEDIYEALDLDNIPQLPTVSVPHAPGAVVAPRDKVRVISYASSEPS